MQIGIVGAGFIGQAVAALALRNGHKAMFSNSRGPQTLSALAMEVGCEAGTVEQAVAFGEIVVVAIPLKSYGDLAPEPFDGKIVIDTGNYYPSRDGRIDELETQSTTTSEILARQLPGAKIVKAFNAIFAREIETDAKPHGAPHRRALPIAGNDAQARKAVAALLDVLGFDVVDAGPLSESWRFERARPAYCVPLDKANLETTLAATARQDFVPEGAWHR